MKKLVIIIASLVAISTASAVEIDGLAATVGTDTILKSEVIDEMRRAGISEDRFSEARNSLIERCLIIKAAKDAKMTMQEWMVDNRVREVIDGSFGGDRNQLIAALANQKMSYPEWVKRIKEDLIVSAMRWNMIDKNVSASPAEMRAEYKSHPERYRSKDLVTVSVMTIKPGETKPEKFDVAKAKTYKNVDPKEAFNPKFQEVIASLKKGEISSWVEMEGWNFMIRKDAVSDSAQRSFADSYDEIESRVRRDKSVKMYKDWMNRLKAETYIKIY